MNSSWKTFILLILASYTSTAHPQGIEQDRQALLAVYEAEKKAHRETDVDALMENTGDEFIAVSNGKIYRQSAEDVRLFFKDYFANASYQEYEDLEEPVVRVSADGSMGWIISRLRAGRTETNPSGVERKGSFIYAGIMLYEKNNGKWTRIANVTTFE